MATQRLKPGDPAPDFGLLNTEDQPAALRDLWANGPTLLSFLRHFG